LWGDVWTKKQTALLAGMMISTCNPVTLPLHVLKVMWQTFGVEIGFVDGFWGWDIDACFSNTLLHCVW